MPVYALGDALPDIDEAAWIAPGAQVMGRVRMKAEASVWYASVLRGDNAWIEIGPRSNVQDGSVLHTDDGYPLTVGADVTIGHKAIVHGCTIEDRCLIGMGACIMNGAVIGAGSLVGAGALVTERMIIPPQSLVLGAPAKVKRTLGDETGPQLLVSAAHYVAQARRHRDGLREIDPTST